MGSRGHSALARRLVEHWYRPRTSWPCRLLLPLAALYGLLERRLRRPPVPSPRQLDPRAPATVVVGNLVVGGAGKTPVVIALVQALRAAGLHPGVVSRGFGRHDEQVRAVGASSEASLGGDEPLLIARRTGVPVWVGRARAAAVAALRDAHPEVDVIVADDGLQHAGLGRDVEIVVFDERGLGNGRLLPAGPLRQLPPPRPAPGTMVLYNAAELSMPWPGRCAQRTLGDAVPLADWRRRTDAPGQAVHTLGGRRVTALAGLAAPERFFSMLEQRGLEIERLALPDHHDYRGWTPPAGTREIVTTEKDAVKLDPAQLHGIPAWVVRLDFALPEPFVAELLQRLGAPPPP